MAITIVLAIVSAAALKPAEAAGLRNDLMNDIQANGVDLSEDDQGGNTETGDELLDAKDEVNAKNLIEISKSKTRDALLAVKAKGNVPYLCTDSSQRCCCTCDCGYHRSSLGDKMKWLWSNTYGRRRLLSDPTAAEEVAVLAKVEAPASGHGPSGKGKGTDAAAQAAADELKRLEGVQHALNALAIAYAGCTQARDNANCTTYASIKGLLNSDVEEAEIDAEHVDPSHKAKLASLEAEFSTAVRSLDKKHLKCTTASDCVDPAVFNSEVDHILSQYKAKLAQVQPAAVGLAELLQRQFAGEELVQTNMLEAMEGKAQNTHPSGCAYKYWTTSCGANGQELPGQTAVNNCCNLPKATRCTDSDTCLMQSGSSWAKFTCSYSTSSGTKRAWCTKYPQQVGKCCRKSCANCGEEDEQLQNTSDTTELLGVLEATGLTTKVADAAGVGWDCG